MEVIISDSKRLEKLKKLIRSNGYGSLHILADFDRTLTYGSVNGIKTPSIISMLRDGKHLTEDYSKRAHELFDKYHPIEIDLSIPVEERKQLMQEWWEKHNQLLIDSGLSNNDLKDIVQNGFVKLREGVPDFLDLLYENNVPLVIFSASGCGDAIQMFFQKIGKDYSNIYYLTNQFNWDNNGKAVSTKGKIIHSMNKDETAVKSIPEIYDKIKNRKNVLLLGDSIGDLGMVDGFDYDTLITVGFFNSGYSDSTKEYEEKFDVVLKGDGDFSFVNDLVRGLRL